MSSADKLAEQLKHSLETTEKEPRDLATSRFRHGVDKVSKCLFFRNLTFISPEYTKRLLRSSFVLSSIASTHRTFVVGNQLKFMIVCTFQFHVSSGYCTRHRSNVARKTATVEQEVPQYAAPSYMIRVPGVSVMIVAPMRLCSLSRSVQRTYRA